MEDVVVTGLGATTPLGGDVATFWTGLLAGRSGVVAISPPNQFPRAIWDELVREGKLKNAGHGMYEMKGP